MKGGSYRRWTQTAATNQFEKAVRRGGSESNTRRVPLIHPWPANHVREEIRLFTLGLTRLVLSLFHHRGGRGQRARRGWIKSSPGETIAYFQSRDGLDCPPSIPVPASIMCPTPIFVRSSSFRVSVFTYAVAESLLLVCTTTGILHVGIPPRSYPRFVPVRPHCGLHIHRSRSDVSSCRPTPCQCLR